MPLLPERYPDLLGEDADPALTRLVADLDAAWAPHPPPQHRDAAIAHAIEEQNKMQGNIVFDSTDSWTSAYTRAARAPRRLSWFALAVAAALPLLLLAVLLVVRGRTPSATLQPGGRMQPPPGPMVVAPAPGPSHAFTVKVDAYLTGLVKHQLFSGSVLIARHGTVLFSKGYGPADDAHHVLNTPRTQFRIAHVTKQFTAVAILLLQERGKLHVRDHICQYIVGCPASWRPITIQQCLNQTSGLTAFDPGSETAPTLRALLTEYMQAPLVFTPGTQFGVSNVGYIVLSDIIARMSGEPFAVFMQKSIFDPLRMRHTGYDRPHLALPYRAVGYTSPGAVAGDPDLAFPNGAYGMYSTTEDLYRWDEAWNSPRLLSQASWAAMFTPYMDTNVTFAGTAAAMWSGDGLYITKDGTRRLAFYSDGSGYVPGLQVFNGRYLDAKVTIIELSNLQTTPENTQDIDAALAAMVFAQK